MNFSEMLDQLKQGKCARRTAWPMNKGYIVHMLGIETVWNITTVPNPNAVNILFHFEDYDANDWLVIDHYHPEDAETAIAPVVQ